MATLTQQKTNKGLLTYSYKENTVIVFAATHITSYALLPDYNLLIKSASGNTCMKFVDQVDRDSAIIILDSVMNLTSTEAFVSA